MQYIQVSDFRNSQPIKIPFGDDGTLTVSSLAAHYRGATGLKYGLDGHIHAVKLANGSLYPPENGWGERTYYCLFQKDNTKRKAGDALETSDSKTSKVDTDLMVLGLPSKTMDKESRDYFSKFGELRLAQIKQEIREIINSAPDKDALIEVLTEKYRTLRAARRQALEKLLKKRALRQEAEDNLVRIRARIEMLENDCALLIERDAYDTAEFFRNRIYGNPRNGQYF